MWGIAQHQVRQWWDKDALSECNYFINVCKMILTKGHCNTPKWVETFRTGNNLCSVTNSLRLSKQWLMLPGRHDCPLYMTLTNCTYNQLNNVTMWLWELRIIIICYNNHYAIHQEDKGTLLNTWIVLYYQMAAFNNVKFIVAVELADIKLVTH